MQLSTRTTQLFLAKLYADAVDNSATLLATLQAAAFGTVNTSFAGKILIEAQTAGVTSKYQLPTANDGGISAAAVSDALSFLLLELYPEAIVALGGTPTDAQVYAQMLSQLVVVRSFRTDFSNALIR